MPAHIEVQIEGQNLDQHSEGAVLHSVEVRQELNHHWWCEIVCRQTEDRRFPIEDCIGKRLEVWALRSDAGTVESWLLFTGLVLEAELEYEIWGSYTARIVGVTDSYKMDLTPRCRFHSTSSMREIGDQLTELSLLTYGQYCDDRDSPVYYIQYAETDFSFLNRLADDHGAWLRPWPEGLRVHAQFEDQATVQWRGEDGLLAFKVKGKLGQSSMSGGHYFPGDMESRTYTEVREEPGFYDGSGPMVDAVKRMSAEKLPTGYVHQRARTLGLEAYEELLKKESVRAIGANIVAWGVTRQPALLAGKEVKIEGVLDASGVYGLTKVIHRWTPRGYENEFWCTPWKDYTHPEAPVMRVWPGVVPARVTANDDPRGFGRIAVRFFWDEQTGPNVWVRVMTPHAGSDRGFYFLPEVGDEVLVGFEDGDPERPIILGSVWNGVDKPASEDFWGEEWADNDCKRIVTKSGHRIQMVDKQGKESMVIATPRHVKISMMENSSESGRANLMLHSDGDIFVHAGGRIHFKSAFFSREVG